MKGSIILLKLDQEMLSVEDLTLDHMKALYQEYGRDWWEDWRLDFESDPLYKSDNHRITPW